MGVLLGSVGASSQGEAQHHVRLVMTAACWASSVSFKASSMKHAVDEGRLCDQKRGGCSQRWNRAEKPILAGGIYQQGAAHP